MERRVARRAAAAAGRGPVPQAVAADATGQPTGGCRPAVFQESNWGLDDVSWDPVRMVAEARSAEAPCSADEPPLQPQPLVASRPDGPGNGVAAPGRGRRGGVNPAPPPQVDPPPPRVACLVPGCSSDSSTWTVYSQRARLCGRHMRQEVLKLPDGARRFCQKCNRLHTLDKFEADKRTCIKQLATFNAWRRATYKSRRTIEPDKDPRAPGKTKAKAPAAPSAPPSRQSARQAALATAARDGAAAVVEEPQWPSGVFPTSDAAAAAATDEVDDLPSWDAVAELMGDDLLAVVRGGVPAMEEGPLPLLLAGYDDVAAASRHLSPFAPPHAPAGHHHPCPPENQVEHPSFWLWGAPTTRSEVAHLKLACGPADLPAGLPQALASMSGDRQPLAASAAVQPGCVLLTYDALVPVEAAECTFEQEPYPLRARGAPTRVGQGRNAVEALNLLRAQRGAVGHFLRRCGAVALRVGPRRADTVAAYLDGDVTVAHAHGGDGDTSDVETPSAWVPVAVPCAALCSGPVATTVHLPTAAAASSWVRSGVRARMHGHWVPCQVIGTTPDGTGVCMQLPAVGVAGLVVLEQAAAEAEQSGAGSEAAPPVEHLLPPHGPSAALVLTSDPTLVFELLAGAPARCADPGHFPEAAAAAAERHNALVLLGHALWHLSPCTVVARAAAVSLRHGWTTAALTCVALLVDAFDREDGHDQGEQGDLLSISLLHEAAASGQPAMTDALISARATLISRHGTGTGTQLADCAFGAPGKSSPFPGGSLTPLHICTMAPAGPATGAALEAATRMLAGPGGREHSTDDAGDAVIAWFSARGGPHGLTPSAMAAARGGHDPFAQLDAGLRQQLVTPRRLALTACAAAQEVDGTFIWLLTCEAAERHLPPADRHSGGAITPWALVLARALLRDAARAALRPAAPPSAAARLWHSLTSRLHASPPRDEDGAHFRNAWRLARLSWLVHTFLVVQLLYLGGSTVRWARAPVPTPELFRRMECHPAAHWPHTGLGRHGVEYPTAQWSDYVHLGVIDYVATLGLPLEAVVTAALTVCTLLARPRAWLTAPGTGRVQALLLLQAACHGCLVTVAMTYRSSSHILAARGAHVAWPLHSSVVMAVFLPFLFGCLPLTPAAAAPVLVARTLLALGSWWDPQRWARLWPVPQTPALALQLLAVALAAAVVVWREAWLRAEYARAGGLVKGLKAKHA